MKAKKPELLSPAGSYEKLQTALAFGADAVYCGLPDFSLRVRINNFTLKTLAEAIKYTHSLGKKIYLTFNIYAHEEHLKQLPKYFKFLKENRPDALIVSDPGIISLLRKNLPQIPLHLSTQANCTNAEAVKFWQKQGITRIILAREVTLKEIAAIHRQVPKMELEYFVHGAMCMSYSGRCILSKWLTGRSANLGDCAQPCRWQYFISEEKRPGQFIPVEEDQHGTYILNSKDLCLIKELKKLQAAGIISFKIEGRAKSAFYVAAVTQAYRQAIDGTKPLTQLIKNLNKIMNREYTTGFLFGKDKWENNFRASHLKGTYQFVGEVVKYKQNQGAEIMVHNAIFPDETLEFITPNGQNFSQKVAKIYNTKNGQELAEAHGGHQQTVIIKTKLPAPEFTVIHKKLKA